MWQIWGLTFDKFDVKAVVLSTTPWAPEHRRTSHFTSALHKTLWFPQLSLGYAVVNGKSLNLCGSQK